MRHERTLRINYSDELLETIDDTLGEAGELLLHLEPGDYDFLEPIWHHAKVRDVEGCQTLWMNANGWLAANSLPEVDIVGDWADADQRPAAGETSDLLVPIIEKYVDRERDIVEMMVAKNVTHKKPMTREDIQKTAGFEPDDDLSGNFKKLRADGVVDSRRGTGGGTYLTDAAYEAGRIVFRTG